MVQLPLLLLLLLLLPLHLLLLLFFLVLMLLLPLLVLPLLLLVLLLFLLFAVSRSCSHRHAAMAMAVAAVRANLRTSAVAMARCRSSRCTSPIAPRGAFPGAPIVWAGVEAQKSEVRGLGAWHQARPLTGRRGPSPGHHPLCVTSSSGPASTTMSSLFVGAHIALSLIHI